MPVKFPTNWRNHLAQPPLTHAARYLQKPSFQEADASGALLPGPGPGPSAPEVAIDSGVVVFSGEATSALSRLAYSETFKGCTARGVAEGASALRLELYSDLLLALKTGAAAGVLCGCGVACFLVYVAFFFLVLSAFSCHVYVVLLSGLSSAVSCSYFFCVLFICLLVCLWRWMFCRKECRLQFPSRSRMSGSPREPRLLTPCKN